MRSFNRFLGLRESLLTSDAASLLRAYWSGDMGAAPILADALDEIDGKTGQLVRLPFNNSPARRDKLVYNTLFRELWPGIKAAAGPVDSPIISDDSTIQSPFVTFYWYRKIGKFKTIAGVEVPYYYRFLIFRNRISGQPPVMAQFCVPIHWLSAPDIDEVGERIGVRPSLDDEWPNQGRPETLRLQGPQGTVCYHRLPQPEDLNEAQMLRAIVMAGSPYGSKDVRAMAQRV